MAEKDENASKIVKSTAKPPNAGKGRPKGSQNKVTSLLKDAIIQAAIAAGEDLNPDTPDGLLTYLTDAAKTQKPQFLQLIGKVLPMQVTGDGDGPITIEIIKRVYEQDNATGK